MRSIQAAQATDIGTVRRYNEDRSLVEYRRGDLLVAVADGVGGEHGGDVASEAAVAALAEGYFRQRRGDLGRALASAMRAANDAVLGAAEQRGLPGAATTVVAAAVRGSRVAIANLGDSRAYLLRGERLRQITADHAGTQARAITRFAGDPRGVNPDVFMEDVHAGDRLLLCSDGVTMHLDDKVLAPLLGEGDAETAAKAIVRAAVERGGRDNATAVVVVREPRVWHLDRILLWLVIILAVVALVLTVVLAIPVEAPTLP